MKNTIESIQSLPAHIAIAGSVIAMLFVMFVLRYVFFTLIRRYLTRTSRSASVALLDALRLPITLGLLSLAIVVTSFLLDVYQLVPAVISNSKLMPTISQVMFILAIIVFADRLTSATLSRYSRTSDILKNSHGLAQSFSRLFIVGLGAMVLLGTMGVSITPIIASLGIGSLAVALALQPTLENFFSGVQLIADKPIRIGDFIELESGEQGFVEKIGWRSTWIKMLPNNIIIMPNSVLSQSKLINYYYPEKELSVPVDVGVHYNSDLELVEKITIEVAKDVLAKHKWGISNYDVFVVFHTFDSSSINFTVMLRVEEYFNRFFVKSAFIKALHQRYRQEGIVIPYPIRAINTQQETEASASK